MLKHSFKVPACSELLRALVLIPVFILCNVDSYVNNHAVLYTFLFVLHTEHGEAIQLEMRPIKLQVAHFPRYKIPRRSDFKNCRLPGIFCTENHSY